MKLHCKSEADKIKFVEYISRTTEENKIEEVQDKTYKFAIKSHDGYVSIDLIDDIYIISISVRNNLGVLDARGIGSTAEKALADLRVSMTKERRRFRTEMEDIFRRAKN